ncbi:ATP-binding protein [Phormidesmis sp. 146-33]
MVAFDRSQRSLNFCNWINPAMSKPVVICVDDDSTILESLKIELKQLLGRDCLVETAEGGEEALELFDDLQRDKCEVALVLADYIMPGLKGDELLKRVHECSPKTLNIMISGQADLEAVSKTIREAKLYRYISKPWQPEDLNMVVLEAIQSYLKDRKLEMQSLQLQHAHTELTQLYQKVEQLNVNLEHQVQERTLQLQQKMQELETLSQVKEDFLYAVSHDLRTPLMGMLLVLKKLQTKPGEVLPLPRPVLNRMTESSDRQLQMLDSLLEAHSSDLVGLSLHRQPIDLKKLVSAIVQELEPWISEHGATLVDRCQVKIPLVQADPTQLRRVYENLIVNAIKHNPPGICLTLNIELEPLEVRCTIQDDGIGMTKADCDGLFDRYVQGNRSLENRSRRSLGLGLGLYLCRQIITAHGGQIGVSSQIDQGATFWFTLSIGAGMGENFVPLGVRDEG